jgi:hypothetical protein
LNRRVNEDDEEDAIGDEELSETESEEVMDALGEEDDGFSRRAMGEW